MVPIHEMLYVYDFEAAEINIYIPLARQPAKKKSNRLNKKTKIC